MKETETQSPGENCKTLTITLRKFICRNSELNDKKVCMRINPTVEGLHAKKSIISQSRKVKKCCVTFYGESISIGGTISALCFELLLVSPTESMKTVGKFTPSVSEINECYKKRGAFISTCEFGDLFWEGHNPDSLTNIQFQEQEDRFLEDFNETETREQSGLRSKLEARRIYSPNIRGESRMRRLLGEMKRESSRSDLISESPHKKTVDTMPTTTQKKRRKVLASPSKNIPSQIFNTEESENSHKLEKQVIVEEIEIKAFRSLTFTSLNPRLPTPRHNLHKKEFPRKKTSIFDKISVKPLIWAAVVGLIGGITATQF